MNLDALVTCGYPPWLPTETARDLDVWWMHDVPFAGTFRMGTDTIVFTVVGDPDLGVSTWACTSLTDADLATLEDHVFDDVDAMFSYVDELFAGRDAVFVLARHDQVTWWTPITIEQDETLLSAANRFLDVILDQMKADNRSRIERAQVDAAMRELSADEPVTA